jgi:hypothetical protein
MRLRYRWKDNVGRENCCWSSPAQSFMVSSPEGAYGRNLLSRDSESSNTIAQEG